MKVEAKQLPCTKIDPKKLPPVFEKEDDPNHYDGTYARALSLIWRIQRQLCCANQNVSYRLVGWLSKIFKEDIPKTERIMRRLTQR